MKIRMFSIQVGANLTVLFLYKNLKIAFSVYFNIFEIRNIVLVEKKMISSDILVGSKLYKLRLDKGSEGLLVYNSLGLEK